MKHFNIGQYVNTPDGIGRILYLTDHQRLDTETEATSAITDHQRQNVETEAESAVVLFGTSATKYSVSVLSPSPPSVTKAKIAICGN
jgi:hypothetical protein